MKAIYVTRVQVEAAKLLVEQAQENEEPIEPEIVMIAEAVSES